MPTADHAFDTHTKFDAGPAHVDAQQPLGIAERVPPKRRRGRPRKDRVEAPCAEPFDSVVAKIQAIPASMRMAVKEEAIRLIDADRARLSVSAGMLCREIIAKINWSKGKDWHSRSQYEKACGLGRSTVKRAYDQLAMYGHALRREADRPDGGHGNAETTLPVLLVAYQRLATNGITLGPEKSQDHFSGPGPLVQEHEKPICLDQALGPSGGPSQLTIESITIDKSSVLANARRALTRPRRLKKKNATGNRNHGVTQLPDAPPGVSSARVEGADAAQPSARVARGRGTTDGTKAPRTLSLWDDIKLGVVRAEIERQGQEALALAHRLVEQMAACGFPHNAGSLLGAAEALHGKLQLHGVDTIEAAVMQG